MTTPESGVVIRCVGLRKTYPLYNGPVEMALDRLGLPAIARRRRGGDIPTFDALQGIDLAIRAGERVGIVGRNGAGKTTLLKLISGNFAATAGAVTVNGQIQALMATGLGFFPQFTGEQNARSALAYNGLSGARLETALRDVGEFAELGEFFKLPMSTYSLGMGARLQFAVATAVEPDIFIVDEVLGAGDDYFMMKSAARMRKLAFSGCTLLLVSHAPQQILHFCTRAIWLDRGKIIMDDAAHVVMDAYEATMEKVAKGRLVGTAEVPKYEPDTLDDGKKVHRHPGREGLRFSSIAVRAGEADEERTTIGVGERAAVEFDVAIDRTERYCVCYLVTVWSSDGQRISRVESPIDAFDGIAGERRKVRIDLGSLCLNPGKFLLSFSVYDRTNGADVLGNDRFDILYRSLPLNVEGARNSFVFNYPMADA